MSVFNKELLTYLTLVIDRLTYVQNIFQPSFVGPLDIVNPKHLPMVPTP